MLSSDVCQGTEWVQAPDFGDADAFNTLEGTWGLVPQSHFYFLDSVWLASNKPLPKLPVYGIVVSLN